MWFWEGTPQELAIVEGSGMPLPPQGCTEPRAQRKQDTQHLPSTSKLSNPFPGLRMGDFSASVSE